MKRLSFLVVVALAAGCGPMKAADVGEQLFNDPRLSGSEINAFSCATCHAMGDAGGAVKAGFDLQTAVKRTRFWGGYSPSLLDATNDCLTFFMRATEPLKQDDPKARALYEYLASTAKGKSDVAQKPLSIVENIALVPKQSKSRGQKVWDAACRACHGDPHTGAGRISETASVVPEDTEAIAPEIVPPGGDLKTTTTLIVIEKIRHGGFFGIGGTMPPFSKEQLSDEDIGALTAFLGL